MSKHQPFAVSAGNRSIKCGKSTIKSSIDQLLAEGFTSITVTASNRLFKEGDAVEIVSNDKSGHYFEIGEQVIVTSTDEDDFRCSNGIKEWYIDPVDIRPAK